MKTLTNFSFKSTLLAVLTIALSTTGCGAIKTWDAASKSYGKKQGGKNDDTEAVFSEDRYLVDTANRFGLMALFAETAYRRELTLPNQQRDREACEYLEADWNGNRMRGMPRLADAEEGWERWVPESDPGKPSAEPPCRNSGSGLFYETYVYRQKPLAKGLPGRITEAVISFRGTENRAGEFLSDWTTSLAAAFGFEPAQYKEAREHLPGLIQRLQAINANMPIYTTGHSLGGGLAQQAGYLSPAVKEVFTFNTSPVTNWTRLRHEGLVKQAYPIIHRVYHGGEFLEFPRFVSTSSTSARYGRHDVSVQFGNRNAASGHSMKVLACNFALLLSQTKAVGGQYNYPTAFIESHVLQADLSALKQFPTEEDAERRKHQTTKPVAEPADPNRRVCAPDPEDV
jgi:hypothetical protein